MQDEAFYSIYYNLSDSRKSVAKLRVTQLNNKIDIKVVHQYSVSGYGKPIVINLPKILQKNITQENLLQYIKENMECNKKVKDKIVMCRFVDVPVSILVKSTQFDKFATQSSTTSCFATPTLTDSGKGKRSDSQTSNVVNNHNEPSQSEVKLPCANIQLTIAYGHGISYIVKMGERSNTSQKNKGDVAEMVSLPFTCQLGPDGKYIRNYVTTTTYALDDVYTDGLFDDECNEKIPEIVLCYTSPQTVTQQMLKDYELFKKGEYFNMLLPTNDFIKQSFYPISSNVPAVDNSIAVYTIADKHLLLITRQDKVGYDNTDIVDMVIKGIERLITAIEHWQQFKDYKIELIYTLAWSRKQEMGQRLLPPAINKSNTLVQLLVKQIFGKIIRLTASPYFSTIMQRLTISMFVENCLSDNVVRESAEIYKAIGEQYIITKQYCQNTSAALNELITNKDFHDIYDTAQYEIFLPAPKYLKDLGTIESYIKKISLPCLQQRMLRGLQQWQQIVTNSNTNHPSDTDVEQ